MIALLRRMAALLAIFACNLSDAFDTETFNTHSVKTYAPQRCPGGPMLARQIQQDLGKKVDVPSKNI